MLVFLRYIYVVSTVKVLTPIIPRFDDLTITKYGPPSGPPPGQHGQYQQHQQHQQQYYGGNQGGYGAPPGGGYGGGYGERNVEQNRREHSEKLTTFLCSFEKELLVEPVQLVASIRVLSRVLLQVQILSTFSFLISQPLYLSNVVVGYGK
jgi:hypothetical protein